MKGKDLSSGSTASYTGTMYHGKDVAEIAVGGSDGSSNWGASGDDVRFDNINTNLPSAGTFRLQTASGTVDIPIYSLGSSSSNVYEFLRAGVANSDDKGFIPLTKPAGAANNFLRVHSQNHGTLAVNNSNFVHVIDDFEDGNLNEWTAIDSGPIRITGSPTYEGSYALECETPSGGGWGSGISTGGLSYYPSQGDKFLVWGRRDGSDTRGRWRVLFGVQDSDSYYEIKVTYPNSETQLNRVENGSTTVMDTVGSTPAFDTWVKYKVDWGLDGTINVTWDDGGTNASLSTTDNTFRTGGIGGGNQVATGGIYAWFDYYHIR